jgi:chromosome segregation ATPase
MSANADTQLNSPFQPSVASGSLEDLNELDLLRDQLASTQNKLKMALTRYEELYRFAEELEKKGERERTELTRKNTDLEGAILKERTELSSQIEKLDLELQAKDQELLQLDAFKASVSNVSSKINRAIGKNVHSLEDLVGFIETFIKRFDTASESDHLDMLAPKGAKIMIEQLKGEIADLKVLRSHLGAL